jgi:hypothetical protein
MVPLALHGRKRRLRIADPDVKSGPKAAFVACTLDRR